MMVFLVGTFILATSLGTVMRIWDELAARVARLLRPTVDSVDQEESYHLGPEIVHQASAAQTSSTRWPIMHARHRKPGARTK
jgi:hypothetical protein